MLHNKRTIGVILVLFTSLGYGTMPAVTQRAFQSGLSVETVLACRFILAAAILWGYVHIKKLFYKLNVKHIIFLLLLGVMTISSSTFMNESYKYVPGAIASLLVSLYVIIVVVMEIALGREKIRLSKLGCILLASTGLFAVVWTPKGSVSFCPIGIIFACLAAFSYALFVIGLGEKRTRETMPEVVTAYTLLPACLFNILRCLAAHEPVFPHSLSQWKYVLYLAVISTFLASVCFCKAVKYIGGSNAALINTMEPLIAYIAGIVLMADVISLRATFGGIMIITAIVWLNITDRKQKEIT